MTRCKFIVKVMTGDKMENLLNNTIFTEIQCANEPNHNGDHLIVVPR